MGGSSSVNSPPMATGKLSSSAQSSTPPIGSNPGTMTNWNSMNQNQPTAGMQAAFQGFNNQMAGRPDNYVAPQAISGFQTPSNYVGSRPPVMRTFIPPQQQPMPAVPNSPYFRNAPVQGPTNFANIQSFAGMPAARGPAYDWARIIAASLFPQNYTDNYGTTGTGAGSYGAGYGGAGGGSYTGISGRNDGGNYAERADGGKVGDMSPEEILELARKIINERG